MVSTKRILVRLLYKLSYVRTLPNLNVLSGLSEQEFFDYFLGMKLGFALELEYTKFFKVPIDPKIIFPDFIPPLSFYYFNDTLIKAMYEEYNYL